GENGAVEEVPDRLVKEEVERAVVPQLTRRCEVLAPAEKPAPHAFQGLGRREDAEGGRRAVDVEIVEDSERTRGVAAVADEADAGNDGLVTASASEPSSGRRCPDRRKRSLNLHPAAQSGGCRWQPRRTQAPRSARTGLTG